MSGMPSVRVDFPLTDWYYKLDDMWNKGQAEYTLHLVKVVDNKGRETYKLPNTDLMPKV